MSLSREIIEQLQSSEADSVREAAYRVGEDGSEEAVPYLVKLLESHNLGIQEASEQALRKIGGSATVQSVVPLLRSDDAPVRNLSMDILREVGNQDFKSLVALLHDDDADIRIFASDILGSTTNILAVEALCESLLKDPEVNVRYQAAVSLGDLAMPEAAKCLNKALSDEEWVQFAVIEALTKVRDESSVDALVRALDSSTDLVASMIVEALGEMGNIKAATMLLRRVDNTGTALRNKIVQAIVKILGGKSLTLLSDAEREKFRQYLLVALSDEDSDIQDSAVLGLAYVGGEMASAEILDLGAKLDPEQDQERLQLILDCLVQIGHSTVLDSVLIPDGDSLKTSIAIEVLGRIGGEDVCKVLTNSFENLDRDHQRDTAVALLGIAGDDAVDFFIGLLGNHDDGTVIKSALEFLGPKMQVAAAGDEIFGLIEHPYNDVKEAALEACIAIGTDDIRVKFENLFSSSDPMHRLMATYALGKLGGDKAKEILEGALEDEVPDIRKIALESLNAICGMDDTCMPLFLTRLHDENSEVRVAVIEMLGQSVTQEREQYLLEALDDVDSWVRIRAMEALAVNRVRSASSKLIELLSCPDKLIALKAIESLGEIGGQTAFKALLDASGSEDTEIQYAAEEAVAKIQSQGEDF